MLEVKDVFENFRFETFVDVHSNIFEEYLSSVIAKLPKENPEYRAVSDKIESLYEQYPKVMFRIQKVQAIYLSLGTNLRIWRCSRFISVAVMTA